MADLNVQDIADATGLGPVALFKQWAAKVSARFNQVGTQAVVLSRNVSSIVDVGNGQTNVNLISAFTGVGYQSMASCARVVTWADGGETAVPVTASQVLCLHYENGGAQDSNQYGVLVYGDLAP